MEIDIKRKWETDRSIVSEIWADGVFLCYGLEPSRNTPVNIGHPCIPPGVYRVVLSMSPHLGYECPEVLNVPGRSHIRWHIGNKPEDVLGCVCVGRTHPQDDWVGLSTVCFHDDLMPLMEAARDRSEPVIATYTDPS